MSHPGVRMPEEVTSLDPDDPIRRAQEGDTGCAALIVSLHGSALAGYARSIASDLGDADRELICDIALEKAMTRIVQFDSSRGTLQSWMRGIVRNEVATWQRTHHGLEALLYDVPDESTPTTDEPASDASEAVVRLIAGLSEHDQVLVALRDRERLPYAEIAERLDVREDALRKRHQRIIERLRSGASSEADLAAYLED